MATAGEVGFGGATCKVVSDTVAPLDVSGVVLAFTAHTLNEYWVAGSSPVTAWDVPAMAVNCAEEQSAGAEAPD